MRTALILTCLSSLAACTQDALPTTAEDTVTFALTGLVGDQDPGVLWDLLPTSYQREVDGVCHQLAAAVPAKAYDKVFRVVHKAGLLLKAKGEDLLSFGPLKTALRYLGSAEEDSILDLFDAIGNVQILLGTSEISSTTKLRTVEVGQFLHTTGKRLWTHGSRAADASGMGLQQRFSGFEFETVEADADRAVLRFQWLAEKQTIPFQRVEGRWLPEEFVTAWAAARARVPAFLDSVKKLAGSPELKRVDAFLDRVLADLDQLQATGSRSEFGKMLEQLGAAYSKELKPLLDSRW